jgi:hypothetical protein
MNSFSCLESSQELLLQISSTADALKGKVADLKKELSGLAAWTKTPWL